MKKGDVAAFVELHIEQGPLLEKGDVQLGIVSAIAAPAALRVFLSGDGGHAGALLMPDRQVPTLFLAWWCNGLHRDAGVPNHGKPSALPDAALPVIKLALCQPIDVHSDSDKELCCSHDAITGRGKELFAVQKLLRLEPYPEVAILLQE